MIADHGHFADYLFGSMDDSGSADVEAHLACCGTCADEVAELVRVSELLTEAAALIGAPAVDAPPRRSRAGRVQPAHCA